MADQRQTSFGDHGFDSKPKSWTLPANITDQAKADARMHLAMAEAACQPASSIDVRKWIGHLGALVAGNMPAEDARVKLAAYVALMEMPVGVVTREALKRAAIRFKWFPSFAELGDFVDAERQQLEEFARRLRMIAEGPKPALAKPQQRGGMKTLGSVFKRDPAPPVQHERTDNLDQAQSLAYWEARMDGKTIDEAFDIATENSGKTVENAE